MRAKNSWREWLTAGGLALVAFGLISLIWGLAGKMQIALTQARSTKAQYQALESRKATLQQNLDSLSSARGQDASIRTAFGVARPGEEVIVVVPPAAATTTPPESWWQKVLDWF